MRRLTTSAIEVTRLIEVVARPDLGGTALFVGTVRRGPEDGPVSRIEYSAYEEMAEAEFERILAETSARWPGVRAEAVHRLGVVPLGEASVAVVAAAPHRAEAYDASRYVIEQIKVRLPVWKKEYFQDGSAGWRGNDGSRNSATVR